MNCFVCLEEAAGDYHPRCARQLFGSQRVPEIDVERAKLHSFALAMTGKTTLPGVQQKVSLEIAPDRSRLQLVAGKGRFILKPQQNAFPYMPENEHVTMCLAALCDIEVPPFGLVRLRDGSLAYLVRRFDRQDDGRKRAAEDFCQLGGWYPSEKYDCTTEELVKLIRKYASETLIDVQRLFRLVVFAWWSGNGDMHAKNFTLLSTETGIRRLSPAYDLVCTRLVIPEDDLALSIAGKKSRFRRSDWMGFGKWCGLPEKAVASVLERFSQRVDDAKTLVTRCYLPEEAKSELTALLGKNTLALRSA